MISDVPIGLFMSSGVDSTLIASLIKNDLGYDIDAYTVKFDENLTHNESALASNISKHLNLRHHILSDPKNQSYNISQMINLYSLKDPITLSILGRILFISCSRLPGSRAIIFSLFLFKSAKSS